MQKHYEKIINLEDFESGAAPWSVILFVQVQSHLAVFIKTRRSNLDVRL